MSRIGVMEYWSDGLVNWKSLNMKRTALILVTATSLVFSNAAFAGGKTYQVTGDVVEVTTSKIVVQKGTERFEMDAGPETKLHSELKVGEKVTVTYTMTASKVEPGGLIKFGTPAPAAKP